ncbi:MAG: hypothetical protein R2991_05745 [Thermoanaerobaculia bacterium]
MERIMTKTAALLAAGVLLLVVPGLAQDQGGGFTGAQEGSLVEIGSPTVTMVVYDFDGLPAGPTSVSAIQAAFEPPAVLMDITNTPRATGAGVYNFQTAGGRALGADPSGSGALVLVDQPTGVFDEVDSFTVVFRGQGTEFGFEIGDWGGPFNVECFDGAASVGSVEVDTTNANIEHFVQSAAAFDSCTLTALPQNPTANWVIPSFQIPASATPVELIGFDVH